MPPALIETVPIGAFSDGDPSKWPSLTASSTLRALTGDEIDFYRISLGNKWKSERKESQSGRVYAVESLPKGYKLFGRNRENDPKHVDKYLYGHPSGYPFRSMPEFYSHFVALMNGNTQGCQCKGCVKPASRLSIGGKTQSGMTGTKRPSNSSNPSSQPQSSYYPHAPLPPPSFVLPQEDLTEVIDEEATPDIWRSLAETLKIKGSHSTNIEEIDSIDWCIEHKLLPKHILGMQNQPRWMPRKGEIVLFMRKLKQGQSLNFDNREKSFRIWDATSESWLKTKPSWEAGMISEPLQELATINDLVIEKGKEYQVMYSGVRVEPMPKIGKTDKPWSKRFAYVPLHNVRPFMLWKEYLAGFRDDEIHPTIKHAITAGPSVSVLHKFHYKGVWPNATVFCKGMYIGPELLLLGDVVRIMPEDSSTVTDVMKVTAVKIKLLNMDVPNDPNPPPWYTCLHVSGVGYTTDATKAHGTGKLPISKEDLPAGLDGYGPWYHLHDPNRRLELPFHRMLGRCYEDEAMMLWLPSSINSNRAPTTFQAINAMGKAAPEVDLSAGLLGTMEVRTQGKVKDPRILNVEGQSWYFGETRVDQLDLREVNMVDVGASSHFGGEVSSIPREAKHLEAMKKAQKARERGRTQKTMEMMSGVTEKLANSTMVARSLNQIESEDQEDEEDSDGVDFIAGSQRGMMGVGNRHWRGDVEMADAAG